MAGPRYQIFINYLIMEGILVAIYYVDMRLRPSSGQFMRFPRGQS